MALSSKQVKSEWERLHWNTASRTSHLEAYIRALKEFGLTGDEFADKEVADIGAGPFAGFLALMPAKRSVSIDPNNDLYRKDGILLEVIGTEYFTDEFEKYAGDKFDAIFCKNALDHGDMSFQTLKLIADKLKDGGRFYLMVNLRMESELNACHDHALTIEDFRKFAKDAGLGIVKEDIWENDKIHGDVYRTLCAILLK